MPIIDPILLGGSGGGDGPSGGSGGSGSQGPTLPSPGEGHFNDPPISLGAPEAGGDIGSTIIYPETPGDLGSQQTTLNRFLMTAESLRENANFNGLVPVNHRYMGHREAFKFNLIMQKMVTICAQLFLIMRSANLVLETREAEDMYPTNTEIATVNHIRVQIKFKEWMLLKDDNKRWFV